jgi:hypothetical protein
VILGDALCDLAPRSQLWIRQWANQSAAQPATQVSIKSFQV